MAAARRAVVAWTVLSAGWIGMVVRWDGLARDPSMWGTISLGVAAMLATLLVFVVTLAPLMVQMHFRHTARLAATVLDRAAIAYGAFFISSTLLPVLAAAAPSRTGTLAVIAGVMPVLGSLVPAVLFFAARLRSDWLLRRRVARAEALLKDRQSNLRSFHREREALDACASAAWDIRLVMKHAGDSWDDQVAARGSAVRLLRAAVTVDTLAARRFVTEEILAFTRLGSGRRSASVRRDVAYVLESTARSARPGTCGYIVEGVLTAFRALGEGSDVTPAKREEFAQAAQRVTVSCLAAIAPSTRPHDTRYRVSRSSDAGRPERALTPFDRHSDDIVAWRVLQSGVATIRELVGPPNRMLDDSRLAHIEANTFAAGCRLLAELSQELQDKHLWVDYDKIIECLAGWLNHRLGDGSGRVDDLTETGTDIQPFPYAVELQAAADAMADIAVSAYNTGFDHVARSALETLVRHAERALTRDAVAFVLAARSLARAHSELFGRGGTDVRGLAAHARAVDLCTSLQEENHRLLATALAFSKAEGETSGSDALRHGAGRDRAMREVLRWALRPLYESCAGYGQLALAIARTAQSVRCPTPSFPMRRSRGTGELSDADAMTLWREAHTFARGRAYELDSDLPIALIRAMWPSEGTEAGLEVFRAGVRWRAALEAAGAGVEGNDSSYGMLADLAGRSMSLEVRFSRQAAAFGRRIEAWAEAPWCTTRIMSPEPRVPGGDELVFIPEATDESATGLGALVRRHRAARQQQQADSEFSELSEAEMGGVGLLWGSWPPPEGCPSDPWGKPEWLRPQDITYRLNRFRSEWERGRYGGDEPRADRIYHARTSGAERIVVTEPDGSSRSDPLWGGNGTGTLLPRVRRNWRSHPRQPAHR
ncbi:hypothetical protein GPA10_39930 [Streptomyces sp. p1417]|uniref:Uncharacterized protein n=1 Tax=Streptomyces typhae TaxID=2681492 RepID=A0A6L6XBA1_9ACTN|nr:hypothetical protein [Streptomyces typhae]MVO90750.1 hypothetical protein [Streptomyces typhae]